MHPKYKSKSIEDLSTRFDEITNEIHQNVCINFLYNVLLKQNLLILFFQKSKLKIVRKVPLRGKRNNKKETKTKNLHDDEE